MEILAVHWQHIIPIIVILIAFYFIQRRDRSFDDNKDNNDKQKKD